MIFVLNMKRILIVFLLVLITPSFADTIINGATLNSFTYNPSYSYYVSQSTGNDSNAGTLASPWKTVAKVNSTTFQPNTTILFKSGDSWREQLVPQNGLSGAPITYSSYGSGSQPLFIGSIQANSGWINEGSNIWQYNMPTIPSTQGNGDVGNIIFNNNSTGVKEQLQASLTAQGDFWYSFASNFVQLYSTSNPASFYTAIELALNWSGVQSSSSTMQYITFFNLSYEYWGPNLISVTGNNVIFNNITGNYIGGANQDNTYTTRYGNGIQIWANASNILVENSTMNNIFESAYTNQGSLGNVLQSNVMFKNNSSTNSGTCYEFWLSGSGTQSMTNVSFNSNNCTGSGQGWSQGQYWQSNRGWDILEYNNLATMTNVQIENNTFNNASVSSIYASEANQMTGLIINNNDYRNQSVIANVAGTNYSTLSAWQNYSGQDLNSNTN